MVTSESLVIYAIFLVVFPIQGHYVYFGNEPLEGVHGDDLPNGSYIAHPQKAIATNGWVRRWEVYMGGQHGSVSFQIWRQVQLPVSSSRPDEASYILVGMTAPRSASYTGVHVFQNEVQSSNQKMWVQAGDVLGLRFFGGNPVSYRIDEDICFNFNQLEYNLKTDLEVGTTYNFVGTANMSRTSCRKYSLRVMVEIGARPLAVDDCLILKSSFKPAILTSPGYPHKYYRNMRTCWVIRSVNDDGRIRIDILDSQLQRTKKSCFHSDYVTVRDGATADSHLLGGWCGPRSPPHDTIMSTSPVVFIRFFSDKSREGRGFKIIYYSTHGDNVLVRTQWPQGKSRVIFVATLTTVVTVAITIAIISYTAYRKSGFCCPISSRKSDTAPDSNGGLAVASLAEEVEQPSVPTVYDELEQADIKAGLTYSDTLGMPDPPYVEGYTETSPLTTSTHYDVMCEDC